MKAAFSVAALFVLVLAAKAQAQAQVQDQNAGVATEINFEKPITCVTADKDDNSVGVKSIVLDPENGSATIESTVPALVANRRKVSQSLILQAEEPAKSVLNAGESKLFTLHHVKIEIARTSNRARVIEADGGGVDATCAN